MKSNIWNLCELDTSISRDTRPCRVQEKE